MILGPVLLLKLVKEKKLVEHLAERELTNPEGAGFDLRDVRRVFFSLTSLRRSTGPKIMGKSINDQFRLRK
jgi:hypothetical protein